MQKEIKKWKKNYKALEKSYIALKKNIKSANITKEYYEEFLSDVKILIQPIYETRYTSMYQKLGNQKNKHNEVISDTFIITNMSYLFSIFNTSFFSLILQLQRFQALYPNRRRWTYERFQYLKKLKTYILNIFYVSFQDFPANINTVYNISFILIIKIFIFFSNLGKIYNIVFYR